MGMQGSHRLANLLRNCLSVGVPTLWVGLQAERPPQDACQPVHSNHLSKCSHGDAAGAEAEFLPQVGYLVQDSERVALAASPY